MQLLKIQLKKLVLDNENILDTKYLNVPISEYFLFVKAQQQPLNVQP